MEKQFAAPNFETSSKCVDPHCVGIAREAGRVLVADVVNKQPVSENAILGFSYGPWRNFIAGVQAGEFDLPPAA